MWTVLTMFYTLTFLYLLQPSPCRPCTTFHYDTFMMFIHILFFKKKFKLTASLYFSFNPCHSFINYLFLIADDTGFWYIHKKCINTYNLVLRQWREAHFQELFPWYHHGLVCQWQCNGDFWEVWFLNKWLTCTGFFWCNTKPMWIVYIKCLYN